MLSSHSSSTSKAIRRTLRVQREGLNAQGANLDQALTLRPDALDSRPGRQEGMWGNLYAWWLRRFVPEQEPELSNLDLWDAGQNMPRPEPMAELLEEVKPKRERGSTAPWGILCHAAFVCLGLAAVMVWGGTEVPEAEWVGTPSMSTERALQAEQATEARGWIDEQVADLGCDKEQRLTGRVAVRGMHIDRSVVRVMAFDVAWAANHNETNRDDVWVEGYCS